MRREGAEEIRAQGRELKKPTLVSLRWPWETSEKEGGETLRPLSTSVYTRSRSSRARWRKGNALEVLSTPGCCHRDFEESIQPDPFVWFVGETDDDHHAFNNDTEKMESLKKSPHVL